MTETMELPALAEAMTAKDIATWENHLAKLLGPKASVTLSVSVCQGDWVHWSATLNGICSDTGRSYGWGHDWSSAIRAAQDWIASRPKIGRNATIRKLALAIIELTDENGKCTVAMLRAKGFDADEIALHAEACVRAGEMAGNVPFSVEGAS